MLDAGQRINGAPLKFGKKINVAPRKFDKKKFKTHGKKIKM